MKLEDSIICQSKDSIIYALRKMDIVQRKLLIVLQDDVYMGLLSIGDLQRAIIAGLDYATPVIQILRNDILVANETDSLDKVKKIMLEFRTEFMPILNSNKDIVEIIYWEDLFLTKSPSKETSLGLPVVVMAGGKGTRLRPLTNVLPKPLIPIDERTILEHIFDQFNDIGCDQFYISLNYKSKMIKYYLESQAEKHYNVTYFEENKPLGTAGSLYLLKDKIETSFFVTNCDILIDQDYSEVYEYHKESGNELTVVVALKQIDIPYGTIETSSNGKLISLKEKPLLTFKINSGVYILEPHLLKEIPANEFFHITALIQRILNRNGKVGCFPVSEHSWRDIGEWNEYLRNIKYE